MSAMTNQELEIRLGELVERVNATETRVENLEKQLAAMFQLVNMMSATMKYITAQVRGNLSDGRFDAPLTTGSPAPTPGVVTV